MLNNLQNYRFKNGKECFKTPFPDSGKKIPGGLKIEVRNLLFTVRVAWNFIKGFRKMHSVMQGGFGTLDEFFESLLLIQTKMINRFPVVLFGKEYHRELITHIKMMHENKNIDESDIQNLLITDSVEEMTQYLEEHSIIKYKLIKSNTNSKGWFEEFFKY